MKVSSVTEGSIVAIIPARGGSKGLPRKNLLPVGGVPLVVRAVQAARRAQSVHEVIVTTDDDEIAEVSRAAGARVIRRPDAISGDVASSESALEHALERIDADGSPARTLVFLQATSPFIDSAAIDAAVAMVETGDYDAVFSAYETYGFLWARGADESVDAVNHSAEVRPRRQEREPHFMETGAFYVMDASGFRQAGHRFFGRVGIVEVPEVSAVEIDDATQLQIARALAPLFSPTERIDVDALVTDFDGVHTDDTAIIDAAGGEQVRVSRSDGMGVALLRETGMRFLILSTETNPVVRARADKLGVPVIHGVRDKGSALREWARDAGVELMRVAYLGNDVNDLPAMQLVGWPVAVADAHPSVIAAARLVLTRGGGDGAVRELIDRLLPTPR